MPAFLISPVAERDLESILVWTQEHFGEQARLCYEALLAQGIADVAKEPDRGGSHHRPEIADAARTYHLWHSRNPVPVADGRVKNPRQFHLYRTRSDGRVEIGRVLHDSTDLERQLPEDYRVQGNRDDESSSA